MLFYPWPFYHCGGIERNVAPLDGLIKCLPHDSTRILNRPWRFATLSKRIHQLLDVIRAEGCKLNFPNSRCYVLTYDLLVALVGARLVSTPSEIRLVTIADREADIFEFLAEADDREAEYVIRAAQDRRLKGEVALLWAPMATQGVVGTVTVEVAAQGGKAGAAG